MVRKNYEVILHAFDAFVKYCPHHHACFINTALAVVCL